MASYFISFEMNFKNSVSNIDIYSSLVPLNMGTNSAGWQQQEFIKIVCGFNIRTAGPALFQIVENRLSNMVVTSLIVILLRPEAFVFASLVCTHRLSFLIKHWFFLFLHLHHFFSFLFFIKVISCLKFG